MRPTPPPPQQQQQQIFTRIFILFYRNNLFVSVGTDVLSSFFYDDRLPLSILQDLESGAQAPTLNLTRFRSSFSSDLGDPRLVACTDHT